MSNPRISKHMMGAILVFIGAIGFSSKAVVVKLAYQHDVDPISLLALRMAFAFPFFAITWFMNRTYQPPVKVERKDYFLLVVVGLMGFYIASFFDFQGLKYISAGLERLILFSYPTIVVILSFFVFGKRLKRIQLIALLVTYLGIALALRGDVSAASFADLLTGGSFIFISAITYAIYLIGSEKLVHRFGVVQFTSLSMMVAAGAVFTHAFMMSGSHIFHLPPIVYLYALIMATISTVIPSYLFSAGIKRIGASSTAIIGSIGPIATIILAYVFLNERISLLQGIGTLVVLGGVMMISLSKEKRKVKSQSAESKVKK